MSAKWTFMVYMAGYNNLSPFATKDLEEMRRGGTSDDVQVAAFIKRLGNQSAQRVLLGADETVEDIGDADSGSPQTLLDFVRWAAEKAPAERHALVVWNHGSGWQPDDLDALYEEVRGERGSTGVNARELGFRSTQQIGRALFSTTLKEVLSLPSSADRGIASDDGSGHSMDTIELNRVLEKVHTEVLGKPLELLGMDACLMSAFEVAFEAQDHVNAVVGSEELEPGDGWPYTEILSDLVADPDLDGAGLGTAVVERYVASYENRRDQWPVTQCAVRTAGLQGFGGALDGLATALRGHLASEVDAAPVLRAQSRAATFTGQLTDLKAFADGLVEASEVAEVRDAATAVASGLEPGDFVVAESHRGPTVEGCGGVTAYLPSPLGRISPYYKDLRFAKECGWDDFLGAYQQAVSGGGR